MKKILMTLGVLAAVLISVAATRLWIYQNNGARTSYDAEMVDSISLSQPGMLRISPDTKDLTSNGGRFSITLQSDIRLFVHVFRDWK